MVGEEPELTVEPSSPPVESVEPVEDQQEQVPSEHQEQQTEQTVKPAFDKEAFWARHSRSGGTYLPPQRAAQQELPEEGSEAYQRLSWEALRKSLNGLINKVNVANIKEIIVELFGENLVRGRGILVKAVMKAQAAALPFTPVYAAMLAVINTKLPMVGELLVIRLINQFRKAYRRNDKLQCLAATTFLAHLVNQKVAHEIVALQVLTLLLGRPTDDSVEIAVGFMKECGATLGEISPKPSNAIFERFRIILHEALIDKRVQYMVEVLFQLRQEGFKGHPAVRKDLDLIDEEDQITHYLSLDDELDPQEGLNVFRADPEFLEKEAKYAEIREEILGGSDAEDEEEEPVVEPAAPQMMIRDETSTDLVNLRKTIYLTVMSSVDFEECGHKLLALNIPAGLEIELCNMIVECCSQERTYLKFFGLLAERFCQLDPVWQGCFETCFGDVYGTVHRLETNKIRNVSKLFGHLLYTDAISWGVLACIHLTEEDTTSASRILIKFLLQELSELFGIPKLKARFETSDPVQIYFKGLFPTDSPRGIRFAINFYTAIGLGALSEGLRAVLSEVQEAEAREIEAEMERNRQEMAQLRHHPDRGDLSDTDSYASSRSLSRERHRSLERERYRSRSRSRSREYRRDRDDRHRRHYRSPSRTPPRHRQRSPSPSRSPPSRHYQQDSRSPPPRHRRDYAPSGSPRGRRDSPPRHRDYSPRGRRDYSPPPRRRC